MERKSELLYATRNKNINKLLILIDLNFQKSSGGLGAKLW